MSDVLFPELEPQPEPRADWFVFDDDGFPFLIGNGEFCTKKEMLKEAGDRLARIEYVTDPDRRKHLFAVHLGEAT